MSMVGPRDAFPLSDSERSEARLLFTERSLRAWSPLFIRQMVWAEQHINQSSPRTLESPFYHFEPGKRKGFGVEVIAKIRLNTGIKTVFATDSSQLVREYVAYEADRRGVPLSTPPSHRVALFLIRYVGVVF